MVQFFILASLCLFGSTFAFSGIRDCKSPKDSGNGKTVSQNFYFDEEWGNCFAFKYTGKGGNNNRYDSQSDCQRSCLMADGGTGGAHLYTTPLKTDQSSCESTVCPKGFECVYSMIPKCRSIEIERLLNEADSAKCPDGSKAGGVLKGYFEAIFAKSCGDLICGKKERCVQVNKHFAKCCGAK